MAGVQEVPLAVVPSLTPCTHLNPDLLSSLFTPPPLPASLTQIIPVAQLTLFKNFSTPTSCFLLSQTGPRLNTWIITPLHKAGPPHITDVLPQYSPTYSGLQEVPGPS